MNNWASQAWIDAFSDVMLMPAQIGLIEADVGDSQIDRAAWLETIKTYIGNRDVMTKAYNPARIGTVLKVFQDEKKRIEREQLQRDNGLSEREKSAARTANSVNRIEQLRRQGRGVSGGSDGHDSQDQIVSESKSIN